MKDIVRLRVLNFIGCALFTAYGIMIDAWLNCSHQRLYRLCKHLLPCKNAKGKKTEAMKAAKTKLAISISNNFWKAQIEAVCWAFYCLSLLKHDFQFPAFEDIDSFNWLHISNAIFVLFDASGVVTSSLLLDKALCRALSIADFQYQWSLDRDNSQHWLWRGDTKPCSCSTLRLSSSDNSNNSRSSQSKRH